MSDEVGAASDRGPDAGVSIVSAASVADLARTGGVEALDSRRFRMLFEVDGVDAVRGGRLDRPRRADRRRRRLPAGNVGRCVVTTCDPATAERDFDTLGVLATYRGDIDTTEPLPLGVVGDVVSTRAASAWATRSPRSDAARAPFRRPAQWQVPLPQSVNVSPGIGTNWKS